MTLTTSTTLEAPDYETAKTFAKALHTACKDLRLAGGSAAGTVTFTNMEGYWSADLGKDEFDFVQPYPPPSDQP